MNPSTISLGSSPGVGPGGLKVYPVPRLSPESAWTVATGPDFGMEEQEANASMAKTITTTARSPLSRAGSAGVRDTVFLLLFE